MSKWSRTHVLIAEGQPDATGGVRFSGASTPSVQPPNWVDWASMYDELVWTISVAGPDPTAPPSAWSLTAKFEYAQLGAQDASRRFQKPRWQPFADEQVNAWVKEQAVWYGPGRADYLIADQTTLVGGSALSYTNALVVTRTITTIPALLRVNLGLSATGGTNPALRLGVEVTGISR